LSKQQGDIALNEHVVSVCFKYFSCFRGILQVFRVDVAKVDRDVTYVVRLYTYIANACSQCFIFFQMYVASVFIWMLYMFHT
jgi:hypothetical protein